MSWTHFGQYGQTVLSREEATQFQRSRFKAEEERAEQRIKQEEKRIEDEAYAAFESFYEDYEPTKVDLNTEQTLLNWVEDRPILERARGAFPDEALSPFAMVQFTEMDSISPLPGVV